jgi:hypothetical protein
VIVIVVGFAVLFRSGNSLNRQAIVWEMKACFVQTGEIFLRAEGDLGK